MMPKLDVVGDAPYYMTDRQLAEEIASATCDYRRRQLLAEQAERAAREARADG